MKQYNLFAMAGDTSVSDSDVCEQLGLDPALAGTPAINDAAVNKMHKENYQGFLSKGQSEAQAMANADRLAGEARERIRSLK
jgi:hypothetical protein